jgi:hypothetical protein
MDQEALEILEMVKAEKVTPEQGAALLEALKSPATAAPVLASGGKPKFIRVRVDVNGDGTDKVAVNANLPIAMADLGLKLLQDAKFTKDGETVEFGQYLKNLGGMDVSTILQLVKEGAAGKLVDVDVTESGGKKIKVEVVVD